MKAAIGGPPRPGGGNPCGIIATPGDVIAKSPGAKEISHDDGRSTGKGQRGASATKSTRSV
jgi:hypothetical protein